MKTIVEKLKIDDKIEDKYKYHPKDKEELLEVIKTITKSIDNYSDRKNANFNEIDTSKITDMSYLFKDFKYIEKIHIEEWDVSHVKNMKGIFAGCNEFNCDLSDWDVLKVEDMSYMFDGCYSFNSDLSKWKVSNVRNMDYMFRKCSHFNSDISKWDIKKVRSMGWMFDQCYNLEQDLSGWNIDKVKTVSGIFRDCSKMESEKRPKKNLIKK